MMAIRLDPAALKTALRAEALSLGFDLFGVAPARRLDADLERFRAWLDRGDAARMAAYLAREPEARIDPNRALGGARSVVMLAMSYAQQPPNLSLLSRRHEGRVARFALGRDYHRVIEPRLDRLAAWLARAAEAAPEPVRSRCFVDTGPLLERAFAREAGLGFIGKNGCLIHPRHGSWFVLGALVTTAELPPDAPLENQCGDCTRCLRACPSGALCEPFRLDARRCLSFLTIETREALSPEAAAAVGDRLFGCDACQSACPFNAAPLPCSVGDLRAGAWARQGGEAAIDGSNATLEAILAIASNREFQNAFEESPLVRARRKGLRRNALTVARNLGRGDLDESPAGVDS